MSSHGFAAGCLYLGMKYLLLGMVILLAGCSGSAKIRNTMQDFADNPIVAHRGAFKMKGYPENSIAALQEAIRLKCTGSEFDIRMTADDSLVINHDPHYHGLDVEKVSYQELAKLPLSNGEPLPTLRQYLLAGKDQHTTRLVCEIKPSTVSKERGKVIAANVVDLVKQLGLQPLVVYISFDIEQLKTVLQLDPAANTQYLNGDVAPEQLKALGIRGADYHFSVFRNKPEWITSARNLGIDLNAWTVNSAPDIEWLLNSGFAFITTNEPELALELAARKKTR